MKIYTNFYQVPQFYRLIYCITQELGATQYKLTMYNLQSLPSHMQDLTKNYIIVPTAFSQ